MQGSVSAERTPVGTQVAQLRCMFDRGAVRRTALRFLSVRCTQELYVQVLASCV